VRADPKAYGLHPRLWLLGANNTVFVNEVFANGRRLFSVFSHALVQVPESIAHITCAQGKHFINEHCIVPKDLYRHFSVLRKCMNNFDCLVHEMLLIRELTLSQLISQCPVVFNPSKTICVTLHP